MYGKAYVDGLKKTNPNLYKKIHESVKHGLRSFKVKGGTENYDYVKCGICDCIKYGNFADHLKVHNISATEYKSIFPEAKVIPLKKQEVMRGNKNPGYKHGGRLSPWSNKSLVHSEEQIEQSKKKAKQNYTSIRTLQYWLNKGFSEADAKIELGKHQSRNLEFFIKKYGEVIGKEKWNNKVNSWQNTMLEKPDSEKIEINLKRAYKNGSVSKGETALMNDLKSLLNDSDNVKSQLILHIPNSSNFFKYDIVYKDKIIEYNGDIWHANPVLFDSDDIPKFPKNTRTAKEIWEKDLKKEKIALDEGYKVLVIWESDYHNNKNLVIQKCLNFLTT
jgi:hypothetical protein